MIPSDVQDLQGPSCECGHGLRQHPGLVGTATTPCDVCPCKKFRLAGTQSPVDHPSHYGGDTVYECIKVVEAWGLGFSLGNCVKYISRAGKKDPTKLVEDLTKAAWYLNRAIENAKKGQAP
jgi:hypothetical protein